MEEDEALEVLRVGCGAPNSLQLPRSEVLQVSDHSLLLTDSS